MPKIFMPVAAAFAPNYTLKDVLIAAKYLLPWKQDKMQSGKKIPQLEERFRVYMDTEKAVSFSSGRSGFYAILKALDIQKEDEILLQAFTTVALPNTIRLFEAEPIFIDIERNTYNIDPKKIEEHITKKTRAIIVQHTFGNPADMKKILELAKKYDLKIIEDCAHSLGAEYEGVKTGKFSDAAFFSFGRDKVISSVAGGMVITQDYKLAEKIEAIRNELDFPGKKTIIKNLLHPVISFTALHTYNLFSIGKIMMFSSFRFGLLEKAYLKNEKESRAEMNFAKRMPNALAEIALHQLEIADRFNRHRIKVAKKYEKSIQNKSVELPETLSKCKNIFLWYTITVANKREFIKKAQEENIILGDWFPQVIGPIEADPSKSRYKKGSCPIAENLSAHCVNLPTHHNMGNKQVKKVLNFINSFK
ncbi:MAG: aminotransferase class I/II-fold pyridoxal phosphate-dependent enzyme [Candidatus Paceibacterota bacterium]